MLSHHYTVGASLLIWVIDADDRDRFDIARDELEHTLAQCGNPKLPVLIFANKQDLPRAASTAEVAEALNVAALAANGRHMFVQPSSVKQQQGLYEGLDWATRVLNPAAAGGRLTGWWANALATIVPFWERNKAKQAVVDAQSPVVASQ